MVAVEDIVLLETSIGRREVKAAEVVTDVIVPTVFIVPVNEVSTRVIGLDSPALLF